MVFVTSRNATASVAKRLIEIAQEKGTLPLFEPEKSVKVGRAGFKSGDLGYLVPQGFGIHHAGRKLTNFYIFLWVPFIETIVLVKDITFLGFGNVNWVKKILEWVFVNMKFWITPKMTLLKKIVLFTGEIFLGLC